MFLASFLIGLREGLEGALIVGILVAFVIKRSRRDVLRKIWLGVLLAIAGAVLLAALFTFGRYGLSFEGQELIGGSMSLLAVVMVTWMVFWSLKAGNKMKSKLESSADDALALGSGWGMFWLAFISVGREGIETGLILWGWAMQPAALLGALSGLIVAACLGYLIYRGMIRIDFGVFFAWMGAFLIVVAAGILAYGIHDLQEAASCRALLWGSDHAHRLPHRRRARRLLRRPPVLGRAAYPFGWAFDLQDAISPAGAAAAF
ncbi:MAG: FTR1 family protein [Tessaracoccus sp.]